MQLSILCDCLTICFFYIDHCIVIPAGHLVSHRYCIVSTEGLTACDLDITVNIVTNRNLHGKYKEHRSGESTGYFNHLAVPSLDAWFWQKTILTERLLPH